VSAPAEGGRRVFAGISASPGVAVGRVCLFERDHVYVARRYVERERIPDEEKRLHQAIAGSRAELAALRAHLDGFPEQRVLLDAHLLMHDDALLVDGAVALVRQRSICADWALAQAIQQLVARLRAAPEPYFRERARDIESVGQRILRTLCGAVDVSPELGPDCIFVADDLGPAEAAQLLRGQGAGLAVDFGSASSHTAILARALDVPAVVGLRGVCEEAEPDDLIIVDGFRGRVVLRPSEAELAEARERGSRYREFTKTLRDRTPHPAETRDGVSVELYANVELPKEAAGARAAGAAGIGLYRTEFLFLDRSPPPSEDEQAAVYADVARVMAPTRVVFRTFDLGGDRIHGYGSSGMNPALGLRAVRFGLSEPAMLQCQLRALLRASVHGQVWIMFPLVSSVDELREARTLLEQAGAQLDAAGVPRGTARVGCMIEVPAAALMADALAAECDFFSVGTNDLAQYTMAVDRSDPRVARLGSPLHPALLKLLAAVAEAAQRRGIPLSLCGAMAADPVAIPVLIGLGYTQLSVDVSYVALVRAAVERIHAGHAKSVAQRLLGMSTTREVRSAVEAEFAGELADLWAEQGRASEV
jgi:phosphoenolpyruvate-protein phosphotransferase (PTS system enzyme I)